MLDLDKLFLDRPVVLLDELDQDDPLSINLLGLVFALCLTVGLPQEAFEHLLR
jgi:hypothetical protein